MAQAENRGSQAGAGESSSGGGARTMGEDSQEVRAIGALLRGEKSADDNGKGAAKGPAKGPAKGAAGAGDGEGEGERIDEGAAAGAGEDEGAGGEGDEGARGDAAGAGEGDDDDVSLGELAKSLGVKEGELFDSVKVEVEVTRADGTKGRDAVTLGELRRGYVGARRLERDREAFEVDADKRGLEFMQTRAELEELGAMIAPHAPREVIDRLQAARGERDARERALLMEAVPEWKDSAKFTADRTAMIEFLKPWGFKAADVFAIADHRIARFVRDMARQAKRSAEAERKARAGNGELQKGRGAPEGRRVAGLRGRLANIVQAGKSATTQDGKVNAIGALLRTTKR